MTFVNALPSTALGLGGSYYSVLRNASPVASWPLDSMQATTFKDRIASATYDLTPTGTFTRGVTGCLPEGGLAATFDGSTSYMTSTASGLLPTLVTVAAVFKATTVATAVQRIAGAGLDSGNAGYLLYLATSTATFRVGKGASAGSATVAGLIAGKWYLAIARYDGTTVKLYVYDIAAGVARTQGTAALAGTVDYTGITNFRIGDANSLDATKRFAGTIQAVSVFSSAISDATVTLLNAATQWTELGRDVVGTVHAKNGINGLTPLDRTAASGQFEFALNNGERNSAGLVGYYSPGHSNCRAGFTLGIPTRLRLSPMYRGRVLWDGATSYYRLGESSGTTATDASGHGYHGTYAGSPTLGATGLIGDSTLAATFDGSDDRMTLPSDTPAIGTTCTIEFWIKPDSSQGDANGIILANSGSTIGVYYKKSSRKINVIFSATDHVNSTALTDGVTYHVLLVSSAGSMTIYVNGVGDGTVASFPGFTPACVGAVAAGSSDRLKGTLDELAVYATAFSMSQIAVHYAARLDAGLGGTDASYYRFRGVIKRIDPEPGSKRGRVTRVLATDWMDEAAQTPLSAVTAQVAQLGGTLVQYVLDQSPHKPVAVSLSAGVDNFPYAFDTTSSGTALMQEFARISASELGFGYLKSDTVQGGVFVWESRTLREVTYTNVATFSDTMQGLDFSYDIGLLTNIVRITTVPRTVDAAATTVLYQLQGTQRVDPGQTVVIEGSYRDPNQRAAKVGGTSMVTPVSSTDYTMNTAADGTGTDLTSSFSITSELGASMTRFTLTNNSTYVGYITLLRVRGKGIYTYESVLTERRDADSVDAIGARALQFEMPYQSDVNVGGSIADMLLALLKDPFALVKGVQIEGTRSPTLLAQAFARDVGDRIGIVETVTGATTVVAGTDAVRGYFIQNTDIECAPSGQARVKWGLVPALTSGAFWVLETAGASELDETTVLGY